MFTPAVTGFLQSNSWSLIFISILPLICESHIPTLAIDFSSCSAFRIGAGGAFHCLESFQSQSWWSYQDSCIPLFVLKISDHKVDAAIKILALHCLFYFQSETWWCFQILAFYCLFWNFPSESWWRRSVRNCACISLQFHSLTYCVFYSDEFDMFSVCIMCGGSDVPSVLLPPKPSYKSGFTWTLHSFHQPHCGNCLCSYWRYVFLNCVAFDIVLCFAIVSWGCLSNYWILILMLIAEEWLWCSIWDLFQVFGSTTQFQFQTLV